MKNQRSANWITGLVVILTMAMAWGVIAQIEIEHPSTVALAATTTVSPPLNSIAIDKPGPSEGRFSPWTAEIVKLARAGIGAGVMLSYVDNCAGTFNLGADEIIQLSGMGVSSQVISTMIQHDAELACGLRTLTASTVPGTGPAVHLIFSAAGASMRTDEASATAPKPAAQEAGSPANNPVAEPGPDVDDASFLSELESALNDGVVTESPTASERPTAKSYSVRQPYAEEVLPPILVVKAAVRTPNVLVIEFSPAPAAGTSNTVGGKVRN